MATCKICSFTGSAYSPLSSRCPTCGFNALAADSGVGAIVDAMAAIGRRHVTGNAIAQEMQSAAATDDMSRERVGPRMSMFLMLHSCAEWVVNFVHMAPFAERAERLTIIDRRLRHHVEEQEVLTYLNYSQYSRSADRLREHCTQGWNTASTKWSGLSAGEKAAFVTAMFDHDKGYPQSVSSALGFVRKSEIDVATELFKLLYSESGTNPYTLVGGTHKELLGKQIASGWPTATASAKANLWIQLTALLAAKIRSEDAAEYKRVLKAGAPGIVEALAGILPAAAVSDYIDNQSETVFESLFG